LRPANEFRVIPICEVLKGSSKAEGITARGFGPVLRPQVCRQAGFAHSMNQTGQFTEFGRDLTNEASTASVVEPVREVECGTPSAGRLDTGCARAALVQRAAEFVIKILGQPNHRLSNDRELRFGNRGSLGVIIEGPKAGLWYDHENGQGGDLFDLVRHKFGCSFREAVGYIEEFVGSTPGKATPPRSPVRPALSEDARIKRAFELWREAQPINDTEAAIYLGWRGVLEPALDAGAGVLRFHPNCPFGKGRHPCLLALMRHIESNEPRAVQRTALTQSLMCAISRTKFADFRNSGQKVTRRTLGPMSGTAIKLSHDDDVAEKLAIGEGAESVLAAMQLGFRPAWALAGTSGIKSFPVLTGIEALTILVDSDQNSAGQQAAQQCSERWVRAGREVLRAIPNHAGDDFNDVLTWRLP
jgi:putative DNA primase/helicase